MLPRTRKAASRLEAIRRPRSCLKAGQTAVRRCRRVQNFHCTNMPVERMRGRGGGGHATRYRPCIGRPLFRRRGQQRPYPRKRSLPARYLAHPGSNECRTIPRLGETASFRTNLRNTIPQWPHRIRQSSSNIRDKSSDCQSTTGRWDSESRSAVPVEIGCIRYLGVSRAQGQVPEAFPAPAGLSGRIGRLIG